MWLTWTVPLRQQALYPFDKHPHVAKWLCEKVLIRQAGFHEFRADMEIHRTGEYEKFDVGVAALRPLDHLVAGYARQADVHDRRVDGLAFQGA